MNQPDYVKRIELAHLALELLSTSGPNPATYEELSQAPSKAAINAVEAELKLHYLVKAMLLGLQKVKQAQVVRQTVLHDPEQVKMHVESAIREVRDMLKSACAVTWEYPYLTPMQAMTEVKEDGN